jgi:hypothetical protein
VAYRNLGRRNAVTKSEPENKNLRNESSDVVAAEKIVSAMSAAADAYSTLLKFSEIQPSPSAQEVMQLLILHFSSVHKQRESMKSSDIRQMSKKDAYGLSDRICMS